MPSWFNLQSCSYFIRERSCVLWHSECCFNLQERLDRNLYITHLRKAIRKIQTMETYTIQDMVINTTDIFKLLCGLGIGNASDCKNDSDRTAEPKGKSCYIRGFTWFLRKKVKKMFAQLFMLTNLCLHTACERACVDKTSYPVYFNT